MTKFEHFTKYERPHMVDFGEIEEVWINRSMVSTVTPVRFIAGRLEQSSVRLVTGEEFVVIGLHRDVAARLEGYYDDD